MIIDDPARNDDIAKSLRGLNKLAKILKQKRTDKGFVHFVRYCTIIIFHGTLNIVVFG
jgi:hypothetical protein